MPKTILFIDDEPHYSQLYIDALRAAEFEVVSRENAEGGLDFLRNNAGSLCFVILDFQMPTPDGVSDMDTLYSSATGRWLLRQARDLIEAYKLPVIVLTNRKVEIVQKEIEEFANMEIGALIQVRHKTHTHRDRLPAIIKTILAG